MDISSSINCRYFVMKAAFVEGLQRAYERNTWATPIHLSPGPQPHHILNDAFDSGKVILIFSISNSKKWQGYAEMTTKAESNNAREPVSDAIFKDRELSPFFSIKWISRFEELPRGLPFSDTLNLKNPLDRNNSINLSRNGQELPSEIGAKLCALIDEAAEKHNEELRRRKAPRPLPPSFFSIDSEEGIDSNLLWDKFLQKVRTVADEVLLATVIGSRRYNLHNSESSDLDLFVVALYPIEKVLALNPIAQTFKNPYGIKPDFTLHGIEYFCELLIDHDTKVFECLFLGASAVKSCSPAWEKLLTKRHLFPAKEFVRRYLHEVNGNKGIRHIAKYSTAAKELGAKMPGSPEHINAMKELNKKWYIILRCLVHAKHLIQKKSNFCTWFNESDSDREFLLDVRSGKYSETELQSVAKQLEAEVQQMLLVSDLPDTLTNEARSALQEWYYWLRAERTQFSFFKQIPVGDELLERSLSLLPEQPRGKVHYLVRRKQLPLRSDTVWYYGVYSASLPYLFELHKQPKPSMTITNSKTKKNSKAGKQQVSAVESSTEYTIAELSKFVQSIFAGDLFVVVNTLFPDFMNDAGSCSAGSDDCIEVLYESQLWKELVSKRDDLVMTSHLLTQALGYLHGSVSFWIHPNKGKPRENELLFSNFDKRALRSVLLLLSHMLRWIESNSESSEITSLVQELIAILDDMLHVTKSDNVKGGDLLPLLKRFKERIDTADWNQHLQTSIDNETVGEWFLKMRFYGYLDT